MRLKKGRVEKKWFSPHPRRPLQPLQRLRFHPLLVVGDVRLQLAVEDEGADLGLRKQEAGGKGGE